MNKTANVLGHHLLRDSTRSTLERPRSLEALLPRLSRINVDEIPGLAQFAAVLLLVPESWREEGMKQGIRPDGAQGFVELTKIRNILGKSPERTQSAFQDEYLFGQVEVNFAEMTVSRAGDPVVLTAMEFKVLKYMIRHERQVITRDALLSEVWGYASYPSTRTVDNHIFRLRQKLEQDPSRPLHLRTVCGAGYKFVSEAPLPSPPEAPRQDVKR